MNSYPLSSSTITADAPATQQLVVGIGSDYEL